MKSAPPPASLPGGGTMAAATGWLSNPTPGGESNGEASSTPASHVSISAPTGSDASPSAVIAPRTSSPSGDAASITRTPIRYGIVQPATSYGWSGGPSGYWRRSG